MAVAISDRRAAGAGRRLHQFQPDHLDYHGTMDAYFEAKMRLFTEVVEPNGTAVIWTDDPKSDDVAALRGAGALAADRCGAGRDASAARARRRQLGQKLTSRPRADARSSTPLIGAYQAANNVTDGSALVLATGGELGRRSPMSAACSRRGRLERA
jgi:UDP-N-acetylmuramoyl-L-alanyl-D-glutamate--2,6-diaminopimelate ligase